MFNKIVSCVLYNISISFPCIYFYEKKNMQKLPEISFAEFQSFLWVLIVWKSVNGVYLTDVSLCIFTEVVETLVVKRPAASNTNIWMGDIYLTLLSLLIILTLSPIIFETINALWCQLATVWIVRCGYWQFVFLTVCLYILYSSLSVWNEIIP